MNLIKGSFIILSMTSVKWLISWKIVKVKYTIYFRTDAGTKTSGISHPYLTDLTVKLQKSNILQASCAPGFADLKNEGAGKSLGGRNGSGDKLQPETTHHWVTGMSLASLDTCHSAAGDTDPTGKGHPHM